MVGVDVRRKYVKGVFLDNWHSEIRLVLHTPIGDIHTEELRGETRQAVFLTMTRGFSYMSRWLHP